MNASEERRGRVGRTVHELALEFGLEVSPRILKDSNNTIVHLAPIPLVAKIERAISGMLPSRPSIASSTSRVTSRRGTHRSCIRAPGSTRAPHRIAGLIATLWQFHDDWGRPDDDKEYGRLLARVHEALADYPGPLPSFKAKLQDMGRILQDRPWLSRLADEDHSFLLATHEELWSIVSPLRTQTLPLHGSPHSGNWLNASEGLLLLDFETACRGPLEWDLSAMGDESLDAFPDIDRDLLALLRRVRSLCVAVKCWIDPNQAPEVGEAAVVHLRLLRVEPLD